MANPLVVDIPKGSWLKVATNVTTGTIHILKFSSMYRQTYRLTGAAAPGALDESEGAEMESPKEEISSSAGIDVYIWCTSQDGRIRVDV